MKKFLLSLIGIIVLTLSAWAQEAAGAAEPTLSQKLIFYGITIAGVAFLVAALRRSKWGRKK
ncbi:MAG: hypothetical protein RIC30_00830 [Marinoscillum sp.]|uniref:hypothetical protein n=1 Tax=Marinoscillum sp. TaxID=2024838 RepID=UPI0032F6F91B